MVPSSCKPKCGPCLASSDHWRRPQAQRSEPTGFPSPACARWLPERALDQPQGHSSPDRAPTPCERLVGTTAATAPVQPLAITPPPGQVAPAQAPLHHLHLPCTMQGGGGGGAHHPRHHRPRSLRFSSTARPSRWAGRAGLMCHSVPRPCSFQGRHVLVGRVL